MLVLSFGTTAGKVNRVPLCAASLIMIYYGSPITFRPHALTSGKDRSAAA